MDSASVKAIDTLIDKAQKAEKADDALKFSQAACNAANALCAQKVAQEPSKNE